tara:strand:- start:317 stop:604 length:288 start_codon:yes stop_codon:yes gene_type:complete
MKISIEFDNAQEARHALDTHLYRRVLMDMQEFIRQGLRYGNGQFTAKQIKAVLKDEGSSQTVDSVTTRAQIMLLECAHSHLAQLCEDAGIDLYDA